MDAAEKIRYWTWCQDKYWQYQMRKEWAYEWRGDTLVRYHELTMPDPDFTKGLLEWLKLPESVHGFEAEGVKYAGCTMYNRQTKFEAEWKPVSAWYEQQEGQIDERTKLKIIRIFQVLQRNPKDGKGDGPYVVENGCMYKVSHTFYWNVPELPEAPQSESGVGYRIGSVARDDETGLWSCYLEKRERVMQEVPEYTSDNTGFAARTEQQFLGVKQDAVAGTGKKASASNGVIVRRRLKKNEDCTTDVTVETVVDKPVEKASVTVERSLRAKTVVTEDRNMPSPLNDTNLPPGTRVTNEKTESGQWNRKKTETVPVPPEGPVRESCVKTLFEHVHQKTEATKQRPQLGHVVDVQIGDGETVEEEIRQLEDTSFEKATVARKELKVEEAVVEVRKTLRGVRRTTVNRSMDAPAATVDMKVGDIVRNEKTAGGKHNQTIETVEKTPVGRVSESRQESALKTVLQYTENVAEKPEATVAEERGSVVRKEVRYTEEGTWDLAEVKETAKPVVSKVISGSELVVEERTEYQNQESIDVPSPKENLEVSAQVRTNEYGLKEGIVVTRKHKMKSVTVNGGAAKKKVEITVEKNTAEAPDVSAKANEEVEVDVSINENGSFNVRKRKVIHEEVSATSTLESELYTEERVEKENAIAEEQGGASSQGVIVETSNSPNERMSFRTVKRTRTAKGKSKSVSWETEDDNYKYTHQLTVYRNQKEVPQPPTGMYRCNVSLSINEYGLYDVIISSETRTVKSSGGDEGGMSTMTAKRWISYQKKDGKLYRRPVTANCTIRTSANGTLNPSVFSGAESGHGFKSEFSRSKSVVFSNISVGAEEAIS